MKYISSLLIFLLFFLPVKLSYSEDALTVKQQLDRIMEEVSDLNKAVFNKSFDNKSLYAIGDENDAARFTSIDIRIYDLEKDIKNLTSQFEEIFFKLDDISKNINLLEVELISKLEKSQINSKKIDIEINNKEVIDSKSVKEKNTLGKLIISENEQALSDPKSKKINEKKEQEIKLKDLQSQKESKMSAEEQLQFALDQMRKKNFDKSKKILKNFVIKFPQNQLSGSAYFWLGKIYLFELNYRNAALVFGEGVQKFPNSIKAPEMYYELAKSLKEMDKIPESCKTLTLLEQNYEGNKFTKDPEKIKDKLNCD